MLCVHTFYYLLLKVNKSLATNFSIIKKKVIYALIKYKKTDFIINMSKCFTIDNL